MLPDIPASSTRAQPGKATAAAHVNATVATSPTKDRAALCRAFLNELKPAKVDPQRWAQVEKQLEAYVEVTKNIQGENFENLLEAAKNSGQVRDLMASFTANSALAPGQHEHMTFRRDLWNIAMTDKPSNDKNKNALGCERSHARESTRMEGKGNIPDCLKPGKQLSVTMRTPIQTDSGNIVDITVVSCVAPALDSPMQPEFGAYVKREQNWRGSSRQTLNKQAYRESFERIRQQVLEAAQKNPQAKTVALPAIGLGAFLDGLEAKPRAQAIQLATEVLADLVCDLRQAGKGVSYMDVQAGGEVWQRVDKALAKRSEVPLGYAGKVPGDWITKDTMLVNAWDPHSLVGNKLARDPSIDGYIGRNTLLHFMHGLHCAAHAADVTLATG